MFCEVCGIKHDELQPIHTRFDTWFPKGNIALSEKSCIMQSDKLEKSCVMLRRKVDKVFFDKKANTNLILFCPERRAFRSWR